MNEEIKVRLIFSHLDINNMFEWDERKNNKKNIDY